MAELTEEEKTDDRMQERMSDEDKNVYRDKWSGWRPGSRKQYVPGMPVNPFHPPEGTPDEVMRQIWGDDEDDEPENVRD